jgi:hypothetical protein
MESTEQLLKPLLEADQNFISLWTAAWVTILVVVNIIKVWKGSPELRVASDQMDRIRITMESCYRQQMDLVHELVKLIRRLTTPKA